MVVTTNSKVRRKVKKKMEISNTEDRISELPDSVIHHILSFLDTKYVIQTSVLSKRWRPLWTSIPTLNFTCKVFCEPKPGLASGFIRFVDTVMIFRDYSDIQRFRLYCWSSEWETISTHVYTRVLGAVRRNVQELYVDIPDISELQFPPCLFTCTSLEKLVFLGHDVYEITEDYDGCDYLKLILNSVNLPKLKYLELRGILLAENLSNKFFTNCPALESLVVKNFHVEDSDMNFNISCPNLKELQIYNIDICKEIRVKTVKIYAPQLRFFVCQDFMSIDYELHGLDCLETADIKTVLKDPWEVLEDFLDLPLSIKELYAQRMKKCLTALHNVEDLALSAGFLEVMMEDPETVDIPPIQFNNLRQLELKTWLTEDSFRAITYLLKISPNIEYLSLFLVDMRAAGVPQFPCVDEVTNDSGNDIDYMEGGSTLPCMLYHLKVVEISELYGCVNELKLLEILLKNSVVLEKLVISSHHASTKKRVMKFNEMLRSFPRPSGAATTMIMFEQP